jgi:multicomponent Na+:H+ antiporter subunit E
MFIFWFAVWLLLGWPPSNTTVVTGILVAAFVSFMTADMLDWKWRPLSRPLRYLWFLYYVLVFLWECVKANLDVAYRVLHPAVPIRPATIRVKTSLKSDAGLTFLASSITLTPGTTTVDIDKDKGIIYVHWIYMRDGYDHLSMRLAIVDKFEKILKRIFE